MPGQVPLIAVGAGSGRNFEHFRRHETTVNGPWFMRTGSTNINVWTLSSTLGIVGALTEAVVARGVAGVGTNVRCFRCRNGAFGSDILVVPVVTAPRANIAIPSWPIGEWVWELAMHSPTIVGAGIDNGFWFTNAITLGAVFGGAVNGLGVTWLNNELTYFTRGPLGLTQQSFPDILGNTGWTRVRFIFRNATAAQPARFQLQVNGAARVNANWETPADNLPVFPLTVAGSVLCPNVGIRTAGAGDWLYYRDMAYYAGPEGAAGVL